MLLTHKWYRIISDTEEHVYRYWELNGPGYNPMHSKTVLDYELEIHLAQLTEEQKISAYEQLGDDPDARLNGLRYTLTNSEVTCKHCLAWIHA